MKTTATSLAAAFFAVAFSVSSAKGETIAPGATYSQNFDSLGNAATASLPSGWKVAASSSARAVTTTEWGAAGTATTLQGTGSGITAGIYNWGDAGNTTDRGVGFLASGKATKTGNLYLSLTATGYIPSFTVSYDMKCYRNNTRQFQFQLYYSTDDGATWTNAGSDFLTSCAVATDGVVVNPAGATSVSSKTLNVPLASGETIILCWSYSVPSGSTTSNAQGLGIDNVSIEAEASSGPAPLATPTGLSVVSVTESEFSLSWTAVGDADDYEVEVLAGSAAAGTVSVSGTGATVGNLSADTAYTAKVKALPPDGSTTLLESDWSVPVSVRTKLADGLEFDPLFDEPFSGSANNSSSWAATTGVLSDGDFVANIATNAGWTGTGATRKAPKSILFGTQSNKGTATTPSIHLRAGGPSSATVRILFQGAKKNGTSAASMNVTASSAAGTVSGTVVLPEIDTTSETDMSNVPFSFVDLAVSSPFTVTFEPAQTDSRCYLDNVIVEQIYDPDYAALAAPTDVAASDIGKYGFTVSWTGVANAAGYEVWLNDAFEASCDATDTSMALAGLSDGTSYKVQVRALGDNLHHGDSPLSEAVFVETEEDIQNVVFTVTGAPSGDVYAGDPVSFAVAAAVENTGAAVPVGFSGISGAAFENGTFSWTPAETDVGPNVATFVSGDYSTNVTITVVSAFATTNLFHETFANCTTKWNASADMPVNGVSSKETFVDEPGWTFAGCLRGISGLKMGTEKVFGTATTRSIEPLSAAIPVQLSFRAAAYAGKTDCSLAVAVSDATGVVFQRVVDLTPMPDLTNAIPAGAAYEFGPYDIVVTGGFSLSFTPASGDGRMGVDEIVVSQTVSAKMQALAAPTGLAVSGEPGETGFTVGWTPVDGATNYVVQVLDASGAVAASAPFCAAASFAATGLSDDEAYTVTVRATGDAAHWFASTWSAPLAVRTARSALHPTLSFGAWQNAVGDGVLHAPIVNTAAVSAALDDATGVPVSYLGATPAPAGTPSFANGTLSWTPADADVGKQFSLAFRMTPEAGVSYVTNVLCAVSDLPPLETPVVSVDSVDVKTASFSWDPEPQYRATGYAVRVWRGTTDYTRVNKCFEDFFDKTIPSGWFATGTGWYESDENQYKIARVKFDATGNTLITKLHSSPVTNIAFHVRSSSKTATSTWNLWASTGGTNETDWISVCSATVSTGDNARNFSVSDNYRRFKWTFEKKSGTMGLGNISVEHAGAGAIFARGCGSASEARSVGTDRAFTCDTLRADTEYFVEVTVTDGTTTQSAIRRFQTLPAPKATVIVVQ